MDRFHAGTDKAILAAAVELVASHGSAGLKVQDVAEKAHVAPATIYYHFANRQNLIATAQAARLTALVLLVLSGTKQTATAVSNEDSKGYESAVTASREPYWDPENRQYLWSILEILVDIRRDVIVMAKVGEIVSAFFASQATVVSDLQELGWVTSDIDASQWVLFYYGAVLGQVLGDFVTISPEPEPSPNTKPSPSDWIHTQIGRTS